MNYFYIIFAQYGGINVDVQSTEGGIYITFTQYNPGDAPGLFVNHTTHTITYREKGSTILYSIQPLQKILFTWNDPAGDKILYFGKNEVENDLRRDGIGEVT